MQIDRLIIRRVSAGKERGGGDPSREQWERLLRDPATYRAARVLKCEPAGAASDLSSAAGGWVGRVSIKPAIADGRSHADVVLKVRALRTRWARAKVFTGFGRAERHWRAAAMLAMSKIAAARPLCLAVAWIDGVACEVLAMQALDGPTLLDCIARAHAGTLDLAQQHRLAEAAAGLASNLGVARLFNRDHKPSNIIVTSLTDRAAELAMIDCVGVRRDWSPLDEAHLEQMCAKLLIEPIGCGVPVRRALWMRALVSMWQRAPTTTRQERRLAFREFVEVVSNLIARHGDPRPRVNPVEHQPGTARASA